MSDSFSLHSYPDIYPASAFWGTRWQKGSLSQCSADNQVSVNYNQVDGQLQISPVANSSETRFNGFVSKWKMNFQNSYSQVEVPETTGSTGLIATLSVGLDCNNWYRILRQGNTLQFQSKTNSGSVQMIASIAYNSTTHQYWRIRHNPNSNSIVFETGEILTNIIDGTEKEKFLSWTQRAETNVNFGLEQTRFEIAGGTNAAAANPAMIKFDNFLFDSNNPEPDAPQQRVDTNYPNNSAGETLNVNNCNNLQTAFNNAQPGDTINISPSLICVGNYELPVKSNPNNKWIIIRSASSAFDGNGMLKAGTRVNGANESHRQQMPKLYTANRQPPLDLPAGANYYRIVGLEFGIAPNFFLPAGSDVYSLLSLEVSATQVHHVTIDRCYFRGELTPNKEIRRAVALNGAHLAVIDSYMSKLIDRAGYQNQAVGLWSGTGPIRIENNYMEALAQNILIGGDSSATPNSTITDVEIRRNYFFKGEDIFLAYADNLPPSNGIEIKQGRRIQISENVFENSKRNGIYIKSVYDVGCVFCTTENVSIKNNKFINVNGFVYIHGAEIGSGSNYPQSPGRITVENNLSYFTNPANYTDSVGIGAREDIPGIRIIHNTFEADRTFFGTNTPPNMFNFEMRDNLTERREYGIGGAEGTRTLNSSMFPYIFRRNVLVNNSEGTDQQESDETLAGRYPCSSIIGNCSDVGVKIASGWDSANPDGDQVKFVESSLASRRTTGNYRLRADSPYKNAGTDGKDIGADVDIIENATRGAISGVWNLTSIRSPFGQHTTIIEAENFDNGGENVAYFETYGDQNSGVYRSSPVEGVDILQNPNASNGYVVFEAAAGEWLEYTFNLPVTGIYDIDVIYSSAFNDGTFHIEIDGVDVTGIMTANSTGNWNTFETVTKSNVFITAGTHILRLKMNENAINPENNSTTPVVANFDFIKFRSNSKTLFDYDGDNKADISVFRPTDGNWYLNNSTDGFKAVKFGVATDIAVPGDFDGDNKTDLAVFRPSTGLWYILNSSDNSVSIKQFGLSGDIPVQADYDGDGKTDIAVFRPTDGTWYLLYSSSNSYSVNKFGTSGDKPAVGDFDGDGISDLAVYRPSNQVWYIFNSSDNRVTYSQFGLADDKIVAGDYDGDGKTDIAVFRPSTGVWYIQNSFDNTITVKLFGINEDIPVPADYNGDGKFDLAVFRPSNGKWYFRNISNNSTWEIAFGLNGDTPTPSVYIR